MPRIKLTKSAIDALPTTRSDVVYWDAVSPGFGVKVTPTGRKVFIVLYRTQVPRRLSLVKTSSTRASLVIPAAHWAKTPTIPAVGEVLRGDRQ
jgi:hypothetical protein